MTPRDGLETRPIFQDCKMVMSLRCNNKKDDVTYVNSFDGVYVENIDMVEGYIKDLDGVAIKMASEIIKLVSGRLSVIKAINLVRDAVECMEAALNDIRKSQMVEMAIDAKNNLSEVFNSQNQPKGPLQQ